MRGHGMTLSDSEGRPARVRRTLLLANALAALAFSVGLLVLLAAGAGSVPALGPLLVPGHGAWTWQFLLTPLGPLGLLP
jgi:hypothetical protein